MNDENIYGGSPLDNIDYTAPTKKNDGPTGVTAPILDDIDYVAPTAKKGGPTGVSAPVLDNMDSYIPNSNKKGAPTGVTAPILDDTAQSFSSSEKKLILSDEDIINGLTPELLERFNNLPPDKQKQIIDMRRAQLGAEAPTENIQAPVLDDDNYVPPPKKEQPVQPSQPITAPILDDEPEAPKYVPKFANEDLEKAKKDARKAVSASLVSNQKDSKESLRMMLELKQERQAELASKGFKISIILSILGIIAAVAFYLLYSGQLGLEYKDGLDGFSKTIESSALYISAAVGMCSLTLITGISGFKSLSSLVFLLFGIIQIFPGLPMLPQHSGSMAKAGIIYGVALVLTIAVFVTLSASECVGLFFKKEKKQYD